MSGLLFIKNYYHYHMKKILALLIIFALNSIPAIADDMDFTSVGELWNIEHPNLDQEAKPVSDEEFEKAIEEMDAKVNKWKNRVERWKRPRGEAFSQGNESEQIKTETGKDSLPVLCVPFDLQIGENILPVGHYQVKGEYVENKPVLKFYQAHYLMAKLPATETNEDFNDEEILFVKLIPQNEKSVKILYGSLDFNAYAIVNTAEITY